MNFRLNTLKFTVCLGLLGIVAGIAQASPNNPEKNDGFQTNEQSTMGEGSFGNSFNPFDLIHNANFRRSRDSAEFGEDTQRNINNAAEEFKRLQQEKFQQQQSNPTPNPSVGN